MSRRSSGSSSTSEHHYDLIVIGGGAGGSNVADSAVDHGFRVALIEEWKLGGTCLNAGCDPTKAMVRSAEVLHLAQTSRRFGLEVPHARADWSDVRKRIDGLIDEIRGGDAAANVRGKGIDLFETHGMFISEHEISVGNEVLSADRFLIATGNEVQVPPVEGLAEVGFITNEDAVALEELPESLVIVGGGFIAVEFAQIFSRFGVDVTVVGSQGFLLPKEDEDLAMELTRILADEGVTLQMNSRAKAVERSLEAGVRITCSVEDGDDAVIQAEQVMLATGRRPKVEGLGLDAAGVAHSRQGVRVDSTMATSVPHIWAIGDVTGIYPFTHVADYQGRIAFNNMIDGKVTQRADYRVVPWVTFTDPELARVGLTEVEARAGGYSVVTSSASYEDAPRAMVSDQRKGMVKLVVDRVTHQVLGGHILGAAAGELIGEIAIVMQHRLPVSALSDTIHPYPTMSEAIFWAAHDLMKGALAGTTPLVAR